MLEDQRLMKDELLDLEVMFLDVMKADCKAAAENERDMKLVRRVTRQLKQMKDRVVELLVCCANVDGLTDDGEIEEMQTAAVCPECMVERPVCSIPPATPRHSTSMKSTFCDITLDSMDGGSTKLGEVQDSTLSEERGMVAKGLIGSTEFEWGEGLETPRLRRVEQNFAELVLKTLEEGHWDKRNFAAEHDTVCLGFKQLRISLKRALETKVLMDAYKDSSARVIQREWMKYRRQKCTRMLVQKR